MPKIPININEVKTAAAKQLAAFPVIDSTELNNAVNTLVPGGYYAPQYTLGSTFTLVGGSNGAAGSAFQYVKVSPLSAALAVGNNLQWATPIAGTVTAAGSTTSVIKTSIDTTGITGGVNGCLLSVFDSSVAANRTFRRIISTTNGAGNAQVGTNTIFTVAMAPDSLLGNQTAPINAFSSVPTNASPCQLMFPNWVAVYDHTALITKSAGIALGTVTAGNYTFIQKSGFGQALMVGGGTAVVAGAPVTPSGVTDGVLIGSASFTSICPGVSQMASSTTVQLMPILICNTAE